MRKALWVYPILLLKITAGCASIKSTAINRTESDVFIGNSNGKPTVHCGARPFNGVPITMRVPTHLDVVIKEKIYFKIEGPGKLTRLHTKSRNLAIETAVVHTEKVFTVDPKRPAAGTLNYTMGFGTNDSAAGGRDNSQYFSKIKSHVEDKTINDITGVLADVTNALTEKAGSKTEPPPEVKLLTDVRTVAWKRFDIDSCDFESQVEAFVSMHMNNCHACEGPQVPHCSYVEPPNE